MTKTVWIYVDTNKKVGDVDHLKVFASIAAANRWFKQNDPEGVASRYEVLNARTDSSLEISVDIGQKKNVSNGDLTTIFFRRMRACSECPYSGTPVAIVPSGGRYGWKALTAPYLNKRYPLCVKRVEEVERELQRMYGLKGGR
jgi:hypothetical protein